MCSNDCAGVWGGTSVDDECGICGGDNSSCADECGVPNGDNSSCADECGVPNGDNSSCADCAGVPNGDAYVDQCDTCDADPSNDCVPDCAGVWGGTSVNDECGVCGGDNSSCADCAGVPNGDAYVDQCGACDADALNDCVQGCDGVWGSLKVDDECGVCDGDNSSCADCAGVPNGDSLLDECGTCDADPSNDCVQDCAGVWGGTSVNDECGICGGDNSSCADCAGVPNGDSLLDECGTCDADPLNDCLPDCAGVWGGTSVNDECGICGGDNSSCADCAGVPNGDAYLDQCGTCDADASNDCVQDCAGVWGGASANDECGVCSGDNSSCADECGLPNGDNSSCADECGVPNGDNSSCADCAGVPNGDSLLDECGTCDADASNDCVQDCAGVWGGLLVDDECGICGGDNSSCADCAGVPNGDSLLDECGTCDADPSNDCVQDCAGVWGGLLVDDECGICGGDNSSCADCAGVPNGDSLLDECGTCDSDPSNDCVQDCAGVWGGLAQENSYYFDTDQDGLGAGGENIFCDAFLPDGWVLNNDDMYPECASNIVDCFEVCDGSAVNDDCGVCNGGNADKDCLGECFGTAVDAGLSIHEGNNLVSFYTMPEDPSLISVFDGIDLDGVLSEGSASAYIEGAWYGSLNEIDEESGYWLQSNTMDDLNVCGEPTNDVLYTLHDANNLLSYSYGESQAIGDALPDDVEDEVFAIVGEGIASINMNGFWVGSLNSFDAGSGYWFARSADAADITFQYNAPTAGDARLLSNELPVVPEEYVYNQSTEQGFYFVESVMIDGEPMSENNWIVAYNEGVIVGARMWNGEYTDVPAMGYDGSTETAGYMELGSTPTFKLLSNEGSLVDLYVDGSIEGWTNNGVDVITLTTEAPLPIEVTLNNSYPNPFNPSTTISFSIPSDMNVDLAVYDISGRLVGELMSGVQTQGLYEITWDASNYASGLYLVRLVAGAEMHTQKIMLVK